MSVRTVEYEGPILEPELHVVSEIDSIAPVIPLMRRVKNPGQLLQEKGIPLDYPSHLDQRPISDRPERETEIPRHTRSEVILRTRTERELHDFYQKGTPDHSTK